MDSISSFAENLILNEVNDIQKGKAPLPSEGRQSKLAPAGKDIRNIKVPNSMMKEILGENFHPQEGSTVEAIPELVWTDSEQEEEISTPPSIISESTAQQLVPLLEEVRNLLLEMTGATTSSGSIGVNLAGPGISKKTRKKTRKETRKETRNGILRERVMNIVRRSR